jgi:plastocyanin
VPTTPGVPAVTEPGTYAVSISNTYTWTDVSEGTHTFSVELVNNDHTPLEPAVYKTISVTVQAQASTVERYLMAENFAFNVSSFSVPAGSAVVLHFENMDSGIQHNFALYSTSSYTGQLYSGTIITGVNSITYTFIAPSEPGIYYFRCDVHPTLMTGTMIVT